MGKGKVSVGEWVQHGGFDGTVTLRKRGRSVGSVTLSVKVIDGDLEAEDDGGGKGAAMKREEKMSRYLRLNSVDSSATTVYANEKEVAGPSSSHPSTLSKKVLPQILRVVLEI